MEAMVTMAAALAAALGIMGKLLMDALQRRNSKNGAPICDPRIGCDLVRTSLELARESHGWVKELRDSHAVVNGKGRKAWMCAADLLQPTLDRLCEVMQNQEKVMSSMFNELKDLRRDIDRATETGG